MRKRLADICLVLLAPIWVTGAVLFFLGRLPSSLLWADSFEGDEEWLEAPAGVTGTEREL